MRQVALRWGRRGALVVLALVLGMPALAAERQGNEAAARAVLRDGARSLEAGEIERAIHQFERALRLQPDDAEVYIYLARAHGAARRFQEAHRLLVKAEIHVRGSRKLRYQIELRRGDLYRDEGEREKARQSYQRAVKLRFFNREARRRLRDLDEQQEIQQPE